jgi:hypothetical protein
MSRRNDLIWLYVLLVSVVLFGFDRTLAEINKEGVRGKKEEAGNKVSSRTGIEYGQESPDFELPRLTIEKDADGNSVGKISEKKVKLSSFRGKKPVFLVFSSYT